MFWGGFGLCTWCSKLHHLCFIQTRLQSPCSVFRTLQFLQAHPQTCVGAVTHIALILPILKDLALHPPCLVPFVSFTTSLAPLCFVSFSSGVSKTCTLLFLSACIFFPFPILSAKFFISCWVKLQVVQGKGCGCLSQTFHVFWEV